MKSRQMSLMFRVVKDDHFGILFGRYRGVIGRGNDEFPSIARSNFERNKRSRF